MTEQGYNYLDGPIRVMAEFFKTRIENLKNQSHQVFPQETRKYPRKGPKKGNWYHSEILRMKIQRMNIKKRSFASTTVWHVWTYHVRVHYLKNANQTGKTEERGRP